MFLNSHPPYIHISISDGDEEKMVESAESERKEKENRTALAGKREEIETR